jgi:hypothetical protein
VSELGSWYCCVIDTTGRRADANSDAPETLDLRDAESLKPLLLATADAD